MTKYALMLFLIFSSILTASDITSWTTGKYKNNSTLVKELHIDGASKLKVKITGTTENGYDFVYIYSANGSLIKKLSGVLDEEFIVDDSSITAKLISDNTVIYGGVTITIEKTSSNSTGATSWTINNYFNLSNIEKKLDIEGADKLLVTIDGKTEANCDFLTITDEQGNEIKKLSGIFHRTFIVNGSSILANFVSDDSTTDRGFKVKIKQFNGKLPDITAWTTGRYSNDSILTQDLRISKAQQLKVKVVGNTEEDYDFFYIYDKQNRLIKKLSGNIDEEFIVDGSSIVAKLTSDDSQTRSGVKIIISQADNDNNTGNYKLKLLSKKILKEDKNITFSRIYYSHGHGARRVTFIPTARKVYINDDRVFIKYKLSNRAETAHDSILTASISELNDINNTLTLLRELTDWSSYWNSYYYLVEDATITEQGNIIRSIHDSHDNGTNYYSAYSYNSGYLKELAQLQFTLDIYNSNILYVNDESKLFFSEYTSSRLFDSEWKNVLCRDFYKFDGNSDNNYWLNEVQNNKDAYSIVANCTQNYSESNFTTSMATFDNNLYRGTKDGKLVVYNLNTESFDKQYSIEFNDTVKDIEVSKDKKRLLLAVGNKGIVVLNITNPQSPEVISTFNTQGYAYDIALSNDGKRAYVADGTNGVIVLDVSDSNNIQQIDKYKTDDKAVSIGITQDNSKVVVADMKDILVLTTR